jgi:hypothetical protein
VSLSTSQPCCPTPTIKSDYLSLKGRLHLRFERAVWMCSNPSAEVTCIFDVQQNLRPITLNAANIAASSAARRCAARTRHHAACSTAWIFENSGQKIGWKEKMTSKTHASLHAAPHAARRAARCRVSEIGCEFCCTSKTHVIAADGSLHIQTAHPKRKCNRPLKSHFVVASVIGLFQACQCKCSPSWAKQLTE